MARTLRSDKLLFWPTLLLVGASLVMVYSASVVQVVDQGQPPYYMLVRQLIWAGLGFAALAFMLRLDYHELRRPGLIIALLAATFLALVAVFFFPPRNNTHRWLTFGVVSIQPSEMAKLAVIVFAASLLERRMHRIAEPAYALMPVAGVTLLFVLLIVRQPDFGTAAVLVLAVTSMLFAAGLSYRYLFGTLMVLLPAAMALIVTSEYRMRRVRTYLDPWADQFNDGYQAVQSFIAVGSGGLFGKGLMGSVQKFFYIPEAHNDFIFAIVGEEFGLIGTTLILACFLVIVWRGMRTALLAPDRFGALLAVGVTMMLGIQALVNISVVTGLLPTKGIPLPFVSAGGSSLCVSLAAMGVLLNISQQASPTAAAATGTT
jgi:cell division protein FtsW